MRRSWTKLIGAHTAQEDITFSKANGTRIPQLRPAKARTTMLHSIRQPIRLLIKYADKIGYAARQIGYVRCC